jgi:predicted alpha/beta-fold hydrolase
MYVMFSAFSRKDQTGQDKLADIVACELKDMVLAILLTPNNPMITILHGYLGNLHSVFIRGYVIGGM